MNKLVTEERWKAAARLLPALRKASYPDNGPTQADADWYANVPWKIGMRVLDVGCGRQLLRKYYLPVGLEYTGIDPFPTVEAAETTLPVAMEDMTFEDRSFDVVVCKAVLDYAKDLALALGQITRVAKKYVFIITRLGMDPDEYHTVRVEFEDIVQGLVGFELVHAATAVHTAYLFLFRRLAETQ